MERDAPMGPSTVVGTLHRAWLVALLSVLLPSLLPGAAGAASPPAVRGTGGAVASGDPLATRAGLELLAAGGNAVDAAVGTALALAVVFPEAGNLGGGGFAVVKLGEEISSLDFREVGPAAARRDLYLDAEGRRIPEASLVGPLAAGVPGSPAGLYELHRRGGRLPWKAVVEPARRLAAEGFVVGQRLHDLLAAEGELLGRFPETAAVWLPGGAPPEVGSTLRLPDLGRTLAAYAERGPEAILAGPVAAAIEEVSRRHGGILTAADLAAYRPAWRAPLIFTAYGWEIASMDLPSSGGLMLAASTRMLEALGWEKLPRFGADRVHVLTESWRRAYADRFFMGDPETTEITAAEMLTSATLARYLATFEGGRATPSASLRREGRPEPAGVVHGGESGTESTETTHLSTVDGDGNLVALTTTLNGLFGCGLYVPGAGFFLNNEMDDFAAEPGKPNLFGLVQGEANAVRPGRRMLSSMTPTIAFRGGEAVALGGRGGSRIPTNTHQVLLNLIVDGDGLQEALDRPRIHHQWLPDELRVEPDALAPETRAVLAGRGHTIVDYEGMAKVHAVRLLADGSVEAAAEPRGAGAAGVVRLLDPRDESLRRRAVPSPLVSAPPP